jgi:hypothetical protein
VAKVIKDMTHEEKNNLKDKIKCPECKAIIPITETLQHQLTESVRMEFEQKIADQDAVISEREKDIAAREKEVHDKEQGIEERVQKSIVVGIEKEKIALAQTARAEAEASLAVVIQDLRDEVKSKKEKLEEAQKNEMELRRKERALEDRAKEMDLEVDRKMDAERKRVEEETSRRITEDHRMKDAEKDKKMSDMMRQIEDLKLKAEQGSQQTQGEVQELELEKELAALFPGDNIQPVPKGMQGADVIQEVISNKGVLCGSIIWESKRTKNWSDGWISKLKDDQRAAQADVAVIITQSLPKDIQHFGYMDGVWITTYACFYSLAYLIRQKLSEIALTKAMVAGKNEKADIIFNYLTGVGFRQRVEAIVEVFSDMKMELDKEKRATQRVWAKKEKQLQSVLDNTANLYGDLQGLIGSAMQTIPALEAGDVVEETIVSSEIKVVVEDSDEGQAGIPF